MSATNANFNRILMVAGRIAQLPSGAYILEFGVETKGAYLR